MQGVRKKTVPAFRNPSSYAIIVKSKQLSALFVSGYRTERYLVQHISHPSKPRVPNASNASAARYVIESDTEEDSEARYSGLGDAMNRKEQ
ncbi:MAG: hypothetical protein P8Y51_06940 [Campylobacterales bacterium]